MWAGCLRGRPDLAVRPDVADRLQLLAKASASAAAIDTRRLVILAASANRQPQGEPAVREGIQRGGLLGQDGGIAQRGDHHHSGQPHPPGHRGGSGQRCKGLVILVGDAVHHPEAAEGTGVCALCPFQ